MSLSDKLHLQRNQYRLMRGSSKFCSVSVILREYWFSCNGGGTRRDIFSSFFVGGDGAVVFDTQQKESIFGYEEAFQMIVYSKVTKQALCYRCCTLYVSLISFLESRAIEINLSTSLTR